MAVPPDFVAGQVLTAAQMNAIGLWEVKSQTIGTTVSSVTVSSAFSSDYDNYVITLTGGVTSASTYIALSLGSTATGYYFGAGGTRWDNGTASTVFGSNQASFTNAMYGNTDTTFGYVVLQNPFNTKRTGMLQQTNINVTTGVATLTGGGYLNDNTSYTAFTLTTVTALSTMSGGIIRVYGYRN